MAKKHYLTSKQIRTLIILSEAPDDRPFDMDELIERLADGKTKQAAQQTIRVLMRMGAVEKPGTEFRRGRNRVLVRATELGKKYVGRSSSTTAALLIEPEFGSLASELDELLGL